MVGEPTSSSTRVPDALEVELEVESLPAGTGVVETAARASAGAWRRARAGRDREGFLFAGRAFPVKARDLVASVAVAGEQAGVLIEIRDGRGGPLVTERWTRLASTAVERIEVPFHQPRTGTVDVRMRWSGGGWVAADRVEIRSLAAWPEQPDALRIACFGDSITAASGYPAVLERLLTDRTGRRITVLNGGRSGHNSRDFLAAMEADSLLPRFDPDLVLVQLGTVDVRVDDREISLTSYRANLQTLTERIRGFVNRRGAHPEVLVATIPPVRLESSPFGPDSRHRVDLEINPAIRELGVALHVPVVETASAYDAADSLSDGVHPTLAAAERLAARWAEVLVPRIVDGAPDPARHEAPRATFGTGG